MSLTQPNAFKVPGFLAGTMWVVLQPEDGSVIEDIMVRATLAGLLSTWRGSGLSGTPAPTIVGIFTTATEAREAASDLLLAQRIREARRTVEGGTPSERYEQLMDTFGARILVTGEDATEWRDFVRQVAS